MYTRKPLPRGFPSFFLFYEVMEEKDMAKNCSNCNTSEEMALMPVAQHEKDQQRLMSIIKKQFIAIIVLICLLFGSFGLFVWYESQYETIDYSYD